MKRNRKLLSIASSSLICMLLITLLMPSVCQAKERQKKTVRVAYVIATGYQEGGEGEYKTGYGYEYLQRVASINDWKYEYVYGSFSELLEKLQKGEVDLMGNLSYTDERAETISYGRYEQGIENYYLYANRNHDVIDALDYSTLTGKKIGVSAGSSQETLWIEWCKEHQIDCEIVEFDNSDERKEALNSGKIDATIGGTVLQDETTADWKVLINFGSSPFYFGVNKERTDLLDELNHAQKEILEENPFYNGEVHDRYMNTLALATTNLDQKEKNWIQQNHNQVKVGYLEGFQPLSYKDEEGNIQGVIADLLSVIEGRYEEEGITFEAVPYENYADMIEALQSGMISAAWPIYSDYWNADQDEIILTSKVITSSMMLVFSGDYTPETVNTIGVINKGSLPKVYAKIYYSDSKIVEYSSYEDAVQAVHSGEIDSVLYETSIYQVNEKTNDELHPLNTVTLSQTFGISMGVNQKDKELVSILNKGIITFGDAGANQSLLKNSAVESKITLKDYLEQNPIMVNILIGTVITIVAAIILIIIYNKMSMRVKISQTEKDLYEKLSNSDPLTGLYNRKAVFAKCQELLKEHPEEQFVMAHIDMVRFRLFNTFFGDEAGDRLLCDIADIFRGLSKEYDYWAYGRIEADVFCAFFPYDERKYREQLAGLQRFFKNYRSDFLIEPKLGVYFVTNPDMPVEAMFTRATLASREVQPMTPYATVVYNEKLEQELNERQQIINEMQIAIDEEQFEVYLQPKYSLRNNNIVGAEALVRWIHPEKGIVSPGAFIPVFESNGFITTLDRYMWEHVCQILSKWKAEEKPMVPISVNVSRLSMYGVTTVAFLKNLINKYEIEPKYLELELTESAYIDNPEEMKTQMLALREAGFQILLDDFGSGYSSLNTLRELPVDVLKLDMRFLSLDQSDIRGGLVVSSIIRMAKLLSLDVIAEGVEIQEQADYLKGVGCEYVQGFLFARPMPVADFENVLTHSSGFQAYDKIVGIEHVGRILAETDSVTYEMGAVIPVSLVCMEYSDREFSFLRANPEFFLEFNLEKELAPAAKIFKKRLSQKSRAALIQAIEDSRQTGKKVTVSILLNNEDGTQHKYICRVSHEGTIGETVMFVAVFVRVTDETLSLMEEQASAESAKGECIDE